jgi:hypothetical protein
MELSISVSIKKGIDMDMGCKLYLNLEIVILESTVRIQAKVWAYLNLVNLANLTPEIGLRACSTEQESISMRMARNT